VERYLPQFSTHVKGLKFKAAMHRTLARRDSMTTFNNDLRRGKLDSAIETSLRERPLNALQQLGIEDTEIADELRVIEQFRAELDAYIARVRKHPIPNIDR